MQNMHLFLFVGLLVHLPCLNKRAVKRPGLHVFLGRPSHLTPKYGVCTQALHGIKQGFCVISLYNQAGW